jgi:hypothetical protein
MRHRVIASVIAAAGLSLSVAPVCYAASGWYLLLPPQSKYNPNAPVSDGYQVFVNASLPQWDQDSAYDTAEACQTRLSSMTDEALGMASRASASYATARKAHKDGRDLELMRKNLAWSDAYVTRATYSRCIKSDDPRLSQ